MRLSGSDHFVFSLTLPSRTSGARARNMLQPPLPAYLTLIVMTETVPRKEQE